MVVLGKKMNTIEERITNQKKDKKFKKYPDAAYRDKKMKNLEGQKLKTSALKIWFPD